MKWFSPFLRLERCHLWSSLHERLDWKIPLGSLKPKHAQSLIYRVDLSENEFFWVHSIIIRQHNWAVYITPWEEPLNGHCSSHSWKPPLFLQEPPNNLEKDPYPKKLWDFLSSLTISLYSREPWQLCNFGTPSDGRKFLYNNSSVLSIILYIYI